MFNQKLHHNLLRLSYYLKLFIYDYIEDEKFIIILWVTAIFGITMKNLEILEEKWFV
jgi:hypothetical protein